MTIKNVTTKELIDVFNNSEYKLINKDTDIELHRFRRYWNDDYLIIKAKEITLKLSAWHTNISGAIVPVEKGIKFPMSSAGNRGGEIIIKDKKSDAKIILNNLHFSTHFQKTDEYCFTSLEATYQNDTEGKEIK